MFFFFSLSQLCGFEQEGKGNSFLLTVQNSCITQMDLSFKGPCQWGWSHRKEGGRPRVLIFQEIHSRKWETCILMALFFMGHDLLKTNSNPDWPHQSQINNLLQPNSKIALGFDFPIWSPTLTSKIPNPNLTSFVASCQSDLGYVRPRYNSIWAI